MIHGAKVGISHDTAKPL